MAEFSPGKWKIDTSRDSLLICTPTPDGYKTLVAYAYTWENARLIAAAPEMYEFIKIIAEDIDDSKVDIVKSMRCAVAEQLIARIDGKEENYE